jgi:hypothetical protein
MSTRDDRHDEQPTVVWLPDLLAQVHNRTAQTVGHDVEAGTARLTVWMGRQRQQTELASARELVHAGAAGRPPVNQLDFDDRQHAGAAGRPPVNQLDFDDRHDTRATESDEMAQRYAELRKDRRRNDWHYLAMGLVVFVVGVAVYLAGFVLVSRLLPHLDPRQVTQIVGLACIAGGGGVLVRSAGRALKRRYDRRRGQASDST